MNQPMNPLACTVQPHPTGGFTPTLHLPGAPVPAPTGHALTLPTVHEAIRYALNHYGVPTVQVAQPTDSVPA